VAGEESSMIDAARLCVLTGLTDRRHRQLAKDGWFPAPNRGRYVLSTTLQGLFRYYREGFKTDAGSELDVARARESRVRGDLLEIEHTHLAGDLVAVDIALPLVRSSFELVRDALRSLPASMSARVNPADPAFAREALEGWADDTLRLCHAPVATNGHAGVKRGRHFGSRGTSNGLSSKAE
jgi:hypothetical protein